MGKNVLRSIGEGFDEATGGFIGDYFMGDTRAARETQSAAQRAKDAVMGGYDTKLLVVLRQSGRYWWSRL